MTEQIRLTAGQTYLTPSGKDAYKLREGSVDVFIISQKDGIFRRPLQILHAEPGDTIPGLLFTDEGYVTWRLQMEAAEDCALTVIEGGRTRPLEKRFVSKTEIRTDGQLSFEQAVIEHYMKAVITEDVFIYRSEQTRLAEQEESLENLDQAAGASSTAASSAEQKAEAAADGRQKGTGALQQCLHVVKEAGSAKAAIILLLLLLAAASILLISRMGPAICLPIYILLRGMLYWRIRIAAEESAEKHLQKRYEDVFSGKGRGRQDPRSEALDLLGAFHGDVRRSEASLEMLGAWILSSVGLLCLIAVWPHAPVLWVTAGLLTVCCGLLQRGIRRTSRRMLHESFRNQERAEKDLLQFLGNMKKIRLAGAKEHVINRYFSMIAEEKNADRMAWRTSLAGKTWIRALIGAVICLAVWLTVTGAPVPPEGAAATAVAALAVLEGLFGFYKLAELEASSRSQSGPEGAAAEMPREETAETGLEEKTLIRAQEVSFGYDGRPVLEEISLAVRSGEYLGIAGASGSGKSTLLKLLAGFLEPGKGSVSRRDDLRMGIVLQDDQLFDGSIRENILAGTDGAGHSALWEAAEAALLTDEVLEMPMEFETLVSDHAETISAGQKQKLLLARALVRSPQILLLDEAESDLDEQTQYAIHQNIRRLVPGGVIVSHHFQSLEKCDRIIMLNQGRIAEEGSPGELIDKRGMFFELMKRQM